MKQRPSSTSLDTLTCIHPNAAGLDIGSREIWVSVPRDRDPEPVRRFSTFTPDLKRLVAWLTACRIDTVALESTGVYWIPVFELLEAAGLKAELVEPRQLKRVPGRKSDYLRASVSVAPEITQSGSIDRILPAGCRDAGVTDIFAPSRRVASTSSAPYA